MSTDGPDRLDQALGLVGYRLRIDPAALQTYTRCWNRFDGWCRTNGYRPMPASSATLAAHCQWLVEDAGFAANTAEVVCTAVRWRHRVAGETPPDRVASWYVLREHHATGAGHDVPLRAACRDDLAMAAATVPAGPAGVRDLLTVLLPYALGVGDSLAAVRIEDLDPDPTAGRVRVHLTRATGRAAEVVIACDGDLGVGRSPGWHTTPGADACPACTLLRWLSTLAEQEVRAGRLMRPVDRFGHVAGGRAHAGAVAAGGGLTTSALRRIAARTLTAADLGDGVCQRPLTALRLGAAAEAHLAGAGPAEVAARAGYAPGSLRLARHLTDAAHR